MRKSMHYIKTISRCDNGKRGGLHLWLPGEFGDWKGGTGSGCSCEHIMSNISNVCQHQDIWWPHTCSLHCSQLICHIIYQHIVQAGRILGQISVGDTVNLTHTHHQYVSHQNHFNMLQTATTLTSSHHYHSWFKPLRRPDTHMESGWQNLSSEHHLYIAHHLCPPHIQLLLSIVITGHLYLPTPRFWSHSHKTSTHHFTDCQHLSWAFSLIHYQFLLRFSQPSCSVWVMSALPWGRTPANPNQCCVRVQRLSSLFGVVWLFSYRFCNVSHSQIIATPCH